jgi:8-oxo-dGTP pyrophosphatase MutT (NUDIX family)
MVLSPHIAGLRQKIGHDLLTMTAAAILVYDGQRRLLLGRDTGTGLWMLPGGAIDPEEAPADAAVRECYEETGLLVEIEALLGVFGGAEFLVTYPNRDMVYYTAIAFQARAVGGSLCADGSEMASLAYLSQSECDALPDMAPSSRVVASCAFGRKPSPYFATPTWSPH